MNATSEYLACANHSGTPGVGRCVCCRVSLCDPCTVFAINDDPWCEACGSTLEEDSRPRYARAAVLLLIAWGLVSTVWIAKVVFVPMPVPYFFGMVFLGYAGGLYAAWGAASPATAGEAPTIVRRKPGSPLPRGLGRST